MSSVSSPLKPLPKLIFLSRWLQLPLYLGLIAAQCVYVVRFMQELWHLLASALTFTGNEIMLAVLGLIDVVLISNLLIMVIIGGYETFVSRLNLERHPDKPEWLSRVNPSVLKVKLALAIISISLIHLLRTFVDIEHYSDRAVFWQVVILLVFIIAAIAIAFVDRLLGHDKAEDDALQI